MKKRLIAFLVGLVVSLAAFSQTIWYRAFSYAYHQKNSYGYWMDWTPWYSCDVNIKIDWDDDLIVIYSNRTQVYVVTGYEGQYRDSSGGEQVGFQVLDQDYDKGLVRLRIERNGNSQLYVDFENVSWVYNVRKR